MAFGAWWAETDTPNEAGWKAIAAPTQCHGQPSAVLAELGQLMAALPKVELAQSRLEAGFVLLRTMRSGRSWSRNLDKVVSSDVIGMILDPCVNLTPVCNYLLQSENASLAASATQSSHRLSQDSQAKRRKWRLLSHGGANRAEARDSCSLLFLPHCL